MSDFDAGPMCTEVPRSWWGPDLPPEGNAAPPPDVAAPAETPPSSDMPPTIGPGALGFVIGPGPSELARQVSTAALRTAAAGEVVETGGTLALVAEAGFMTALRWTGLVGLIFLPPPDLPQENPPAPQPLPAPLGPNGERPEHEWLITPDSLPRGFIRADDDVPLRPGLERTVASGDTQDPPASGEGTVASTPSPADMPADTPADERDEAERDGGLLPPWQRQPGLPAVDLAHHIGREGREGARPWLVSGQANLLVGHGGYRVDGLRDDAVFEVPPGSAVTVARPGVALPVRLADSFLHGDWRGTGEIEALQRQNKPLDLRNQIYLAEAQGNDGLHPYLEGAATWLPGARLPDYRIRAPEGLRVAQDSLSVSSARFATLSELLPPNAGHLCVSACTQVKVSGTGEKLRTLHDYEPLKDKLDLPGEYRFDAVRGDWVHDAEATDRLLWDWRHAFDVVDLTPAMTAPQVAGELGLDMAQLDEALTRPSALFDYSRFRHPLSLDPGIVDVLAREVPAPEAPSASPASEISQLSAERDRIRAVHEQAQKFQYAVTEAGLRRASDAIVPLMQQLSDHEAAIRWRLFDLTQRELDRLLESGGDPWD